MLEEGSGAATEALVIPENRIVQASWFDGYLQGNSRFPRKSREGIGTLTLDKVLNAPPVTWDDFFNSKLSQEQMDKLGRAMNTHHRHAEVLHSTQPEFPQGAPWWRRGMHAVTGNNPYHITEDDLASQWETTTEVVGRIVLGYRDQRFYEDTATFNDASRLEVADFLSKPYTGDALRLKQIMDIAATAVMDPAGKRISDDFIALVKGRTSQSEQEKQLDVLRDYVTSTVKQQFPEERLGWLYAPQAVLR